MATNLDTVDAELEETHRKLRERLNNERAQIWDQMKALEDRLSVIERYLVGFKRMEDTVAGKLPVTETRSTEAPKPRAHRTPRADGEGRRTGIREEVFNLVKEYEEGVTAKEISERMNANDPKDRQAIANALAALKKEEKLDYVTEGGKKRGGLYRVAGEEG